MFVSLVHEFDDAPWERAGRRRVRPADRPSPTDGPRYVDRVSKDARGRTVVDGAMRVLRALPESDGPHQVRELATITGLPRPTVHRLLNQLVEAGVAELVPDRGYRLTSDLVSLARRVEPSPGLRATALPLLADLRERTGATVALVARISEKAVVLEAVPGRDALPVAVFSGRILPPSAAGAIVLTAGESRHGFAATDNEALVAGLTCWAVRLDVGTGPAVSLQLASPPERPADIFAGATREAAALIGSRLRRAPDLRL